MKYDYLILNGTVIDGSGGPASASDIGVTGDHITAIGPRGSLGQGEDLPADRVIDASGMLVTPGFIDIHTHTDMTLFIAPHADSKLRQGVTTEVVGNCSLGLAPLTSSGLDACRKWWAGVDKGHRRAGRVWKERPSWSDYMSTLDDLPVKTNIALLVPHGPLRVSAMSGELLREATDSETAIMAAELGRAMAEGAFGLSTGLVYIPSQHAQMPEITELVRVVASYGGVYATHIRGEDSRLPGAIAEAIDTCLAATDEDNTRSALRLQIAHLKASGAQNWGTIGSVLETMERARSDDSLDVMADVYPYTMGGGRSIRLDPDSSFEGSPVEQITDAIDGASLTRGLTFDPNIIYVVRADEETGVIPGMTLQEAADSAGTSLDALVQSLFQARAEVKIASMSEDDIIEILKHPLTCVGSDSSAINDSDLFTSAWQHPRAFGTFPRFLSHYVRELGVVDLGTAIRKITSIPASRLGLKDRGRLSVNMKADIVVFDYEGLTDRSSYGSPFEYPTGIEHVLINGCPAVRYARDTGTCSGRILRS